MKAFRLFVLFSCLLTLSTCQDQLDIKNPNTPPFANLESEDGIVSFATGGIYSTVSKYTGPGTLWVDVYAFHELMGDAITCEFANIGVNQFSCPDLVVLDDGTQVPNPSQPPKQKDFIRQRNQNQNLGNNPLVYEWGCMYAINNTGNMMLSNIGNIHFSGDSIARSIKASTLKAWAYFWKGYAYSRLGSMYYAGIINNQGVENDGQYSTNADYVTKENILIEATRNFSKADSILSILSPGSVYNELVGKLIPSFCQVGKGGIVAPDMWRRQMNSMKARNILVNTAAATMSTSEWNEILALTSNGIQLTDYVFTIRSNGTADLVGSSGNVPNRTGPNRFFQISERLAQDFEPGDLRFTNNFTNYDGLYIGSANRGNALNSRWMLLNKGAGLPGVVVYQNRGAGAYEEYFASFYEENQLMKAEALINLGNVDAGLLIIDNIRFLQGAGLAATAGTGLSQAEAISKLRSERRVALAFRGLSFYDARRFDVINTGRAGAVVLDKFGHLNVNATIYYNYLDYWDVPDNELKFNPPSPASSPVRNPNGL